MMDKKEILVECIQALDGITESASQVMEMLNQNSIAIQKVIEKLSGEPETNRSIEEFTEELKMMQTSLYHENSYDNIEDLSDRIVEKIKSEAHKSNGPTICSVDFNYGKDIDPNELLKRVQEKLSSNHNENKGDDDLDFPQFSL